MRFKRFVTHRFVKVLYLVFIAALFAGLKPDLAAAHVHKMYWTDSGTNKIQRANLDGSNVEDLVTTGLDEPWGIALDVAGGKMYWTDEDDQEI